MLDYNLRLPRTLKLFDGSLDTVVLNGQKDLQETNLVFKKLIPEKRVPESILAALYELNILSVLVEGGRKLLQSFIDEETWDEMRIITNEELTIPDGIVFTRIQRCKICLFRKNWIRHDTLLQKTIKRPIIIAQCN